MGLFTQIITVLSQFEIAFITLFTGLIIAKIVGKIARWVLLQAELDQISAGISDALSEIIKYVLYAVTLFLILQQFKLTKPVFFVLLFAITAIFVVLVLVALLDFILNAALGLYLRSKLKRFKGKRIQIGLVSGVLTSIGPVDCVIKDKEIFVVPYKYVLYRF